MIKRYMQLTLAALLLTGAFLAAEKASTIPAAAKKIADSFSTDRMRTDLNFLASDLLEGRGTGQRGGDVAAAYIAAQFQIAGLKPAGENGTYMQMVPLNGVTAQPESTLKISGPNGEPIQLKYLDDFVANPYSQRTEEPINGPLVFVGYGVNAPEFGWNDYAGLDAKGKVVLALVNDPPSQDPKFFGGKAMTYYGRWTYKYEEAARQGAAGILLIHNTDMASYGWNVVRNSWSGEQAFLANPPGQYALPMAGWITEDVGKKIATAAGTDLNALFDKAKTKGFKPMELPLKIEGKIIAKTRPLHAQNVIGVLEGSDPKLKDEAIVYSAHYDHLGVGVPVDGDNIYNGALDNASGTALLIELARVFAESPVKTPRSIIFLSVTAEERGLKGSEYYGLHPSIPAKQTMINLNYDGVSMLGEATDVVMTGADRTSIFPMVQEVTKAMKVSIVPEEHPEAGYYYRSDHFSMARVGVPAFSLDLGNSIVGKPADYGEKAYKEYNEKHYHQPSDEVDPKWDYSGAKELARLGVYVGWKVAEMQGATGWRPGDEFEKARK